MKVKIFDEENEKDLENNINMFLLQNIDVINISYQVAFAVSGEEQIYCFSALIVYH